LRARQQNPVRRFLLLVFSAFLLFPCLALAETEKVKCGFSSTTLSNIDARDAEVALRVWLEQILKNEGVTWEFTTRVYDTTAELYDAYNEGNIDVAAVSTMEYLHLAEKKQLEGEFTTEISEKSMETMQMLVRGDSGYQKLEQLQGKRLIIDTRLAGENPVLWLCLELKKRGLPKADAFFRNVTVVKDPSKSALPVFFKTADACIIREQGLQTLAELNPQIGKQLAPILTSPPYIRGVIAFRRGFDPDKRETLRRSALKLHQSARGQQVLTLFKADRVIPLKPEHLLTTIQLRDECRAMKIEP
ncbi:MAG TPA: PhnD/SsuA/transferrin family substrate-binding protein, partial [Candidatus Ozemobacteraceae bacterium]|nr:PhnD/SsuA/transferrin family substrate-binding protein [Candidatus Ozemobacteraceae bacterium]